MPDKIADDIRECLKRTGMTITEFARRTGQVPCEIRDIESGKTQASVHCAKYLRIRIQEFELQHNLSPKR